MFRLIIHGLCWGTEDLWWLSTTASVISAYRVVFRFGLSATNLLTWLPVHLGVILKSGTFQVYKKKINHPPRFHVVYFKF